MLSTWLYATRAHTEVASCQHYVADTLQRITGLPSSPTLGNSFPSNVCTERLKAVYGAGMQPPVIRVLVWPAQRLPASWRNDRSTTYMANALGHSNWVDKHQVAL